MSVTLCLLYSLTYVIFRAFLRRARPSQTSYPSVSRFSKWRRVGPCVARFVKFPALLFMMSRKAREPGVSDTENRAKGKEDYPPFLLLFRLSFVKPYFNIFFIPIWTLREDRNGHISSLQFDGQFNRLG